MQAIRPKQETADNKKEALRAQVQVFALALRNDSDAPAVAATISIGDWHTLELLLPAGAVPGTLHIRLQVVVTPYAVGSFDCLDQQPSRSEAIRLSDQGLACLNPNLSAFSDPCKLLIA